MASVVEPFRITILSQSVAVQFNYLLMIYFYLCLCVSVLFFVFYFATVAGTACVYTVLLTVI